MAEQRTFNPLVQGSTPWRPTQTDLRLDVTCMPYSRTAIVTHHVPELSLRGVPPLRERLGCVPPWLGRVLGVEARGGDAADDGAGVSMSPLAAAVAQLASW